LNSICHKNRTIQGFQMKLRLETLEYRENPSVVIDLPMIEVGTAFVDGPPSIDDPDNWTIPGPNTPPPSTPPSNPDPGSGEKFPVPPPVPTGPG
jgi:hypothetical protein